MPDDFYKVGPPSGRHFDDLGLRALERDWAAWPGEPSKDLMMRSQFNLFFDIGIRLFGRNSSQALNYALYVIEKREPVAPVLRPADRQGHLVFVTV